MVILLSLFDIVKGLKEDTTPNKECLRIEY